MRQQQQQQNDVKDSWPKMVVKKWLNINNRTDQFHSDYKTKAVLAKRRKSCSDDGLYVVVPEEFSDEWLMDTSDEIGRPGFDKVKSSPSNDLNQLRMFVGTWNVAGKSPENGLNLIDWVKTKAQADIYVLGFQEIVPLNAGNVLGPEDCGPAAKWLSLIRTALNGDTANSVSKHSPSHEQLSSKPRVSFSDLIALEDELQERRSFQKFSDFRSNSCSSDECSPTFKHRYSLVASKQMVGIFLCIWVREDLYDDISSVRVSSVGRGILGYLGNKGSISVSLTFRQTSLCFVCTHLASGEKEGDAMRRNLDVMEILKRTRFSNSSRGREKTNLACTILAHEKIIWLGDLNYRLASPYCDTHELLERSDWQALLEKDELRIEQKAGRVFKDWEEGEIYFAPTYKYLANSDCYVVHTLTSKEKRRTPAWCDRILWKGEGLNQMCYVRGESNFSDHRPVYSLFSVDLNSPSQPNMNIFKSSVDYSSLSEPKIKPNMNILKSIAGPGLLPEAEFLLVNRTRSCIQSTPRFSTTGKR